MGSKWEIAHENEYLGVCVRVQIFLMCCTMKSAALYSVFKLYMPLCVLVSTLNQYVYVDFPRLHYFL